MEQPHAPVTRSKRFVALIVLLLLVSGGLMALLCWRVVPYNSASLMLLFAGAGLLCGLLIALGLWSIRRGLSATGRLGCILGGAVALTGLGLWLAAAVGLLGLVAPRLSPILPYTVEMPRSQLETRQAAAFATALSYRATSTPLPPETESALLPSLPSLGTYHNQIVFVSDKEDPPGLWVMNPDGTNRRYLGREGRFKQEYDALREKEAWSPDSHYRVYRCQPQADKIAQLCFQPLMRDSDDLVVNATPWAVTHLRKIAYDPVWSPDGAHVAFVGQEASSDDIWVLEVTEKDPRNLTPNVWEWDKHPSWSPDSQRIAFWSNRDGLKQIYVMNWQGDTQVNISRCVWDEYDPIWIQ
jgi:hypothetical protein